MINKNIQFIIVGEPGDQASKGYYEELKKFPNVTIKGRLSHLEAVSLISNAKALINTSDYEGFSNVFLEAWATGVPVISLNVNPDNIIKKFNLGICCEGDLKRMKMCIERDETSNFDKNKLKSYVSEFHDFNTAADRFLNLID
jgi:glycosyltransferase involved in cell wall biosynthesis